MYCNVVFKCIRGKNLNKKWYFQFSGTTTVVIGRLTGCHMVVEDSKVSQSHCLIQIQNNLLCLVDMGSTYGTLVNSNPAEGAVALSHADEIRVGDTVIQLKILQSSLATLSKIQTQAQTYIEEPEETDPATEESVVVEQKIIFETENNPPETVEKQQQDAVITKVYPSPRLHKKCMLCEEVEELNLSAPPLRWQYCHDCEDFARYICGIHEVLPILDEPVQIDWHGVLLWVKEDNFSRLLYVARHNPQELRSNFLQHIDRACDFSHPNLLIPQKYEIIKGRLCIFFPAIHGEFVLQHNKELTLQQLWHIATQLCYALEISEKILGNHGEIYEGSVYQHSNGQVSLYGYGLPRSIFFSHDCPVRNKTRYRHEKFSAPEVFSNKLSCYSDIFSIAALLYAHISKKSLYYSQNREETYRNIATYQAPWEETLPTYAKHLLHQALLQHPEERYSSIANFVDMMRMVRYSL